VQDSLELDGLANSHAVRIPVEDPKRIGEIFDAISYKKVKVQYRKQRELYLILTTIIQTK